MPWPAAVGAPTVKLRRRSGRNRRDRCRLARPGLHSGRVDDGLCTAPPRTASATESSTNKLASKLVKFKRRKRYAQSSLYYFFLF